MNSRRFMPSAAGRCEDVAHKVDENSAAGSILTSASAASYLMKASFRSALLSCQLIPPTKHCMVISWACGYALHVQDCLHTDWNAP